MAYEMVMPYHLHMPSYFLETFTEYPFLCPYPGFLFRAVFISPALVRTDKPVLPLDCLYVFPRHPIV